MDIEGQSRLWKRRQEIALEMQRELQAVKNYLKWMRGLEVDGSFRNALMIHLAKMDMRLRRLERENQRTQG